MQRKVILMVIAVLIAAPIVYGYRAYTFFQDGERSWREHNCRKAIALLGRSLSLYPFNSTARKHRGACLREIGLYRSAIQDFSRLIESDSRDAAGYMGRAHCWLALGEWEQAEADASRAAALSASNPEAHFLHGQALENLGRFSDATEEYSRALASPSDEATASKYHFRRGHALLGDNFQEKALKDFEEAVRLAPSNAEFAAGLAHQLVVGADPSGNDAKRAMELARKAIELDEQEPNAPLTKNRAGYLEILARALAASGDFQQAEYRQQDALDTASSTAPPANEQIRERMGQCLEQYKRKQTCP